MSIINFKTALNIDRKKYSISEQDIKDAGITQMTWVDIKEPPLQLCSQLLDVIKRKYHFELINNQPEILAAEMLGMSYGDFINLLRIGGIDSGEGVYGQDTLDKNQMERARLDAQARMGCTIPREEFEEYYSRKK